MTRSIFGKDVGALVEDIPGADYLLYHNPAQGEATALRPRMDASGQADSRLLRLTTISNDKARMEKSVIWELCSAPVQTDLARKFGLRAPAQVESKDIDTHKAIEDPRNAIMRAKPSDFVHILNDFRIFIGSEPFTDDQQTLLTEYVAQIFERARIKQTHILIATHYLERLPPEQLEALSQNELDRLTEEDAPALDLKKLIAGTVMLAKAYSPDDHRPPGADKWKKITSLSNQNAVVEVFSALGYDASIGEVGDELDLERPAAVHKAREKFTFLPQGGEKRVVKATPEEEAASAAERAASHPWKQSLGNVASVPHSSRGLSLARVSNDLTSRDERRFQRALANIGTLSLEEAKRGAPARLISAVNAVDDRLRLPLIESIVATCVRLRYFPPRTIDTAVLELRHLNRNRNLEDQRERILTLALTLQIHIGRDPQFLRRNELASFIGEFGTRAEAIGIVSELTRQRSMGLEIRRYIAKKPVEAASSDALVEALYQIGSMLKTERDILDELDDAFDIGETKERRVDSLDALKRQLQQDVTEKLAPPIRSAVLADIAARVGKLRSQLDKFDESLLRI